MKGQKADIHRIIAPIEGPLTMTFIMTDSAINQIRWIYTHQTEEKNQKFLLKK